MIVLLILILGAAGVLPKDHEHDQDQEQDLLIG
jgi:hypothetical protein